MNGWRHHWRSFRRSPAAAPTSNCARNRAKTTAYIASWLEVLQNDNRAIFTAAAHSQRAAE
jgi:antirestriction protein ArdC